MDEKWVAEEKRIPEAQPLRPERKRINARCDRYACLVCRTKTGWPHQVWCEMARVTEPECTDCRYWSAKKSLCDHPVTRRERAAK